MNHHGKHEGGKEALVIVVSDAVARGERRDEAGPLYKRLLEERGWVIEGPQVAPNSVEEVTRLLLDATCRPRLVVVVGGTGPSPRDVSVDVVSRLSWRDFPGFGEEFRRRSLGEAGPRGLGSRAGLYQVGKALVAVVPGSPRAASLAVELLDALVPHLLEEFSRPPGARHGA